MANLGNAYINIIPKAPGISRNIEGIFNEGPGAAAGEKAGRSLGSKLIKGFAAIGVGLAVKKLVSDAFSAGGALQQSFGGLETIYGEAADAAKEYASAAASAGISANSYAEQAVSFGAALKQAYGGDTVAAIDAANLAIMDMADNSAKMGTDLSSIQAAYQGFAKQNYTMLDNLKLGYGGTKTEMERLLKRATELSGVEYNIDNLGDVYSAIHVIQEDLGLTGVAALEAKTTLTGSMNAVKASWENVMAALTTGDGLDTAMAGLTESVGNFAQNVLGMLRALGPQLPGLVLGLADVLIQNAPAFLQSGIQLIVELGVGLVRGLPDLIAMLPEIFSGIFDAFGSVDWMQLGADIITGIINGIWAAAQALWNTFKDLGRRAIQAAKDEIHAGSPSRDFADEVGSTIPWGIAVGINENMAPLNSALSDMLAMSNIEMGRAVAAPAGVTAGEIASLLDAAGDRPVNVQVVLQGDAREVFRVVEVRNATRTKATGYNTLARRTANG